VAVLTHDVDDGGVFHTVVLSKVTAKFVGAELMSADRATYQNWTE
jgi:hypothetical protein